MLCWFLPYINRNQPQVYICPLPFELPSHLLPHSTPLSCHRAPVLYSNFPLAIYSTRGSIYMGRSPGERNSHLLQYSCLKNSIEQRSLAGCSPWGHRVGLSLYVSALLSQCIPAFPHWVHKSILYICISIPALQIGSSVLFL